MYDQKAFDAGWKDGKKIDLKRRRIEDWEWDGGQKERKKINAEEHDA
jgi:hypothetical protein